MLESPPTIRLPRPDELPNNPKVFERLKGRENANIVEGYKLSISKNKLISVGHEPNRLQKIIILYKNCFFDLIHCVAMRLFIK